MSDALGEKIAAYEWVIALGSNLGDGPRNLKQARRALEDLGHVAEASAVFETAPMYDEEQPRFYNAAVLLQSDLRSEELLKALQRIESEYGRVRESDRRYGPRAIDLDIIAGTHNGDNVVVDSPGLRIPHARMHERAFVLVPLDEIVSQWRHPVLGETLEALLENAGQDDSFRIVCRSEEWA